MTEAFPPTQPTESPHDSRRAHSRAEVKRNADPLRSFLTLRSGMTAMPGRRDQGRQISPGDFGMGLAFSACMRYHFPGFRLTSRDPVEPQEREQQPRSRNAPRHPFLEPGISSLSHFRSNHLTPRSTTHVDAEGRGGEQRRSRGVLTRMLTVASVPWRRVGRQL